MKSKQNTIPSPCIRQCCLDNDDVCLGCFRLMEEIMNWEQSDETARRAILIRAMERRERHRLKRRPGGVCGEDPFRDN
ncbi:MAG: DUF1289 domain-containing protein [Gammaproteobacteria bacterium]